jgi:hypothetical protein
MGEINWERLVVVTAVHGEKYLGWLACEDIDPKKYLEEHGQAGSPITLQDARNLVSQAQSNVDHQGNVLGVSRFLLLMPIDVLNGPLPSLQVIPSSWYFPGENGDDCKKKIGSLLSQAVEQEARLSAAAAGLVAPVLPLRPVRE